MSDDITNQLQIDLVEFFSACPDESTNVILQTRLTVFIRFSILNVM